MALRRQQTTTANGGGGSGGGGRAAKANGKGKSLVRKPGPLPIGFYVFTDWEAARQVRADGQVVASEAVLDSFKFTNRHTVCRRLRLPRACVKPAAGGAEGKGRTGGQGGEAGAGGGDEGVVLLLPCTYEAKQEGTFTLEATSADAQVSAREGKRGRLDSFSRGEITNDPRSLTSSLSHYLASSLPRLFITSLPTAWPPRALLS